MIGYVILYRYGRLPRNRVVVVSILGKYALLWCQKWSGMHMTGSVDNFVHAWKRFRLPATAKQCQEEKQLQILPTFLRGVVAVSTIKESARLRRTLWTLVKRRKNLWKA